jgi:hypothetical protein
VKKEAGKPFPVAPRHHRRAFHYFSSGVEVFCRADEIVYLDISKLFHNLVLKGHGFSRAAE